MQGGAGCDREGGSLLRDERGRAEEGSRVMSIDDEGTELATPAVRVRPVLPVHRWAAQSFSSRRACASSAADRCPVPTPVCDLGRAWHALFGGARMGACNRQRQEIAASVACSAKTLGWGG